MSRLIAFAAAFALFLGVLFTPAAEAAIDAAVPQRPAESIRQLNYNVTYDRMRGDEAYGRVLAGTPASVTSLYVLGSSDFGVDVPQNPRFFLSAHASEVDFYLSGRGGSQPLTHAIELGAVAGQLPNHKAVLLVSPQWFGAEGMNARELGAVFSVQQWQRLLANPAVSPATKDRLAARLAAVDPSICERYVACRTDKVAAVRAAVAAPLQAAQVRTAVLRETWDERRHINHFTLPWVSAPGNATLASFDWDAAWAEADAQGRAASTNDMYIDDNTYRGMSGVIRSRSTAFPRAYHPDSPGYTDLQLFLDVARETGTRVLLVSAPLHARWTDQLGFDRTQRAQVYERVRQLAASNGVALADHTSYEYEPYFFFDLMHLGRKGWVVAVRDCYTFALS